MESLKELAQQERNRLEVSLPIVSLSIHAILTSLKAEINTVEPAIKSHINNDPDLKQKRDLLTSIPGIADITSALLLAEVPVECHHCAKSTAAFIGLNPKPYESGSSVRGKGRISKTGAARLRAGLYMSSVVATRYITHRPTGLPTLARHRKTNNGGNRRLHA